MQRDWKWQRQRQRNTGYGIVVSGWVTATPKSRQRTAHNTQHTHKRHTHTSQGEYRVALTLRARIVKGLLDANYTTHIHTYSHTHRHTTHWRISICCPYIPGAAFALLPKKPEAEFRIELPFSNSPLCLVSRGLTLQQSWKLTTILHCVCLHSCRGKPTAIWVCSL